MDKKLKVLLTILTLLTTCCSTQSKTVKATNASGVPNLLMPEVKCVQKPDFTDDTHWEQGHLVCEIRKGATWSPK
jgi:hypothetical protein